MDSLKRSQGHSEQTSVAQEMTQQTTKPSIERPGMEAIHPDRLETSRLVLSAPAPRPQRIALFSDYISSLPKLDSEEKEAALKELAQKLNMTEIESVFKKSMVSDVKEPESEFQSGKVVKLGAVPETISTEATHLNSLDAFNRLLSDETLQSKLSRTDRNWLQNALPELQSAMSASAQLLQSFYLATGVKPDTDAKAAFKAMTPEQRRSASENLLRVFNSTTYKKKFMEAATSMNAKFEEWDAFAKRNQSLLTSRANALSLPQVKLLGFNPSVPMIQRGPRYELLLKEAAGALPQSYESLATAARLSAKAVGMQINENRASVDAGRAPGTTLFGQPAGAAAEEKAKEGAISRFLSWLGWR